MNKRGTLIHWIIFAVLAALGLFLVLTANANFGTGPKGQWPLAFLTENYLAAEKESLKLNLQAKTEGREIARELAINGGFKVGSDCGVVDGIPLWNFEEEWCLPKPEKGVQELFLEKKRVGSISEEMRDIEEVGLQNNDDSSLFFGHGSQKTVQSSVGRYSYPVTFSIDLGYSFEEYQDLLKEAAVLVQDCRNKKEIKSCIIQNQRWKPGLCGEELKTISKRTVPFCVESPRGTVFGGVPLQYQIGLDFTPIEPWAVDTFTVEKKIVGDKTHYEIQFEQDPAMEQYLIYYTDWPEAINRKGTAEEVFASGVSLKTLGYFQEKITFANPASGACPAEKEANKAYWCDKMVVYVLADTRITAGTYFTITAVKGSEESKIERWEQIR